MHSKSHAQFFTQPSYKPYRFPLKGKDAVGMLELIPHAKEIDLDAAREILVESFITEYQHQQKLSPEEIDEKLTSWRSGQKSVQQYYQDYFKIELNDFKRGEIHFWIHAYINEKLVGWATFLREKKEPNAVYMNLLIVHPDYQKLGIGKELVYALKNMQVIPELTAVHLLLRKKNEGGRTFYSKLGFHLDPDYNRDDNFVDKTLLEGWTWKNPALEHKADAKEEKEAYDTYCGFKPGFLLGKRF